MKHLLTMAILVLTVSLTPMGPVSVRAQDGESSTVVSGRLLKLDLDTLRGLLTTDLAGPVFFEVPKPYLFENVTIGARITLGLDDHGRAVKVMDTSLPDLVPAIMPAGQAIAQPLATSLLEGTLPADASH